MSVTLPSSMRYACRTALKKAFALEQLYNEDATQIKCKVVGGVEDPNNDDTKWMEWQANALAPRIQMPLAMFKRQASAMIRNTAMNWVFLNCVN